MKRNELKRLLDKFEAGTLTDDEAALLQAWYHSFGEEETGISSLEDPATVKRIAAEMSMHVRQLIASDAYTVPSKRRKLWMPAAAAAILIFGILLWQSDAWRSMVVKQQVPLKSIGIVEVNTTVRQVKQLTLAEGTKVYVNANSSLRIPEKFHGAVREVFLDEGEAYFEVAGDSIRPFVVHTAAGIQVNVLGTAFNIQAYQALDDVSIAVKHGKVRVSKAAMVLGELTVSQGIHYRKSDGRVSKITTEPGHINAWTGGVIRLEEAEFAELALAMYNLYGVQLERASSQTGKDYLYNVVLRSSRTLEETMEIINRIHKTTFRRDGNVVKIYP